MTFGNFQFPLIFLQEHRKALPETTALSVEHHLEHGVRVHHILHKNPLCLGRTRQGVHRQLGVQAVLQGNPYAGRNLYSPCLHQGPHFSANRENFETLFFYLNVLILSATIFPVCLNLDFAEQ